MDRRKIINKLIEWDWRFTWPLHRRREQRKPAPKRPVYRGFFPEDYWAGDEVD